jgi:hypothetical protein
MMVGLSLMGLTYGSCGHGPLRDLPTPVRYTGSSSTFNFASILGATLAPYIATWLANTYGLEYVGYYLRVLCTGVPLFCVQRAQIRLTPYDVSGGTLNPVGGFGSTTYRHFSNQFTRDLNEELVMACLHCRV